MTALDRIIRDNIAKHGPMPFARFMDFALNHPELGYYRNGADPFGIKGDFFTASQLQPVFGDAIAKFTLTAEAALHDDRALQILELGAGRQELSDALKQWSYRAFDWNTPDLPDCFCGLVIANEFFDALPIHLLRRRQTGWFEVAVTLRAEQLVFEDSEPAVGPLLDYAERYGTPIPVGGLLEVNLNVRHWIHRLASMLSSGWVLVIDYGYSASELARFPQGTLVAYTQHRVEGDLLSAAGTRDLTAHVNFTHLRECAIENGFDVIEERSLAAWLSSLWSPEEFEAKWKEESDRWRLQWKQLVFGMGETFRVMVLQKRKGRGCAFSQDEGTP